MKAKRERVRPELEPTGENLQRFVRWFPAQARKLAAAEGTSVEDAQQEIALVIMSALKEYDPKLSPLKQWLRRVVSLTVSSRVRRQGFAKRRPWTWSYDQTEGWQRERAQLVSDPEVLDAIPADAESEQAKTPEDLLLAQERQDRFMAALQAAEAVLCKAVRHDPAVASEVFRARVTHAARTGHKKFSELTEFTQQSGIPRRVEERIWRRARKILWREISKREIHDL